MFPIHSVGISELVILVGVAGLALVVPLVGAAVMALLLARRRAAHKVEEG